MASVNENPESKMAEKEEESKLKAKYPQLQRPGPQFLQKRLQKGQKFFDSGDYNMAKAAAAKGGTPKSRLSMNQSSAAGSIVGGIGGGPQPPLPPTIVAPVTTGEVIPTPDCLATRKASIHVPNFFTPPKTVHIY
ncbi:endosulfine alpha isoform X1 [Dermatophagoides farinae]|uniref:endosulfine alpha isoform X1 n=1 Tax=Dermatophagoides farinae TaxID=6954 RepID=UPI003F61DF99